MTNSSHLSALPLLAALLLSACGPKEPPVEETVRPVRTMKVGNAAALKGRSFPGRAKATQEVDLSFRVKGPLISFPVQVGDKLDSGDLVARIDPRDYEVQLRNVQGQLERANANRKRAQGDFDRSINIQKQDPGAISQAAVDRAREALDLSLADIAALEASVDAAKDALNYTYLKAPFAGSVVATYVENFETVQPKQTILRLLDNSRVEFMFSVPETMISLIGQVRKIRVRFDAFPDVVIPAELKEVGSEASELTRTYPITLIMDQPAGVEILPGMAGKVTGEGRSSEYAGAEAIVIPVTAVFSPNGQDESYVWVVDPGAKTVSRRGIAVGSLVSGGVVVTSGLDEGDLIATAGVHYLKEGQAVRPSVEE